MWLLLIILLFLAVGGAPSWGWHHWGWGPSGVLGTLLLVVLVLVLIRRA